MVPPCPHRSSNDRFGAGFPVTHAGLAKESRVIPTCRQTLHSRHSDQYRAFHTVATTRSSEHRVVDARYLHQPRHSYQ